jgi:RNA polymerase sigma-70 factor (ECF subfamily)
MALLAALEGHRPRLLAMVQRRLDPALAARLDAEAVVNKAIFDAQRRWSADTPAPPYAWLYRLTLDTLIEAWRHENRACRSPQRELPWPEHSSVQLGLGLVAPDTSPSSALERRDLQAQMRQALDLLRPTDREILWMRHADQLSFREVAEALGITPGAANVRYVRALGRLKQLWLRLHPGEELEP